MKPGLRIPLVIGIVGLVAACSGGEPDAEETPTAKGAEAPAPAAVAPSAAQAASNDGSVKVALTIDGGQLVSTLNWAISGPGGTGVVVQAGSVDVQNGTSLGFVTSGLAPASGYLVALSASTGDNSVTCTGSAPFSVTARATTQVSVLVRCAPVASGGQATLISGDGYSCAAITGVAASPTETTVGSSIALQAEATGPQIQNITYAWSATRGAFDAPSSAAPHFTCTAPGPVTITLAVGDGPVPEGGSCNPALDTTSVVVQCDAGSPTPAPALPLWAIALLGAAIGRAGVRRRREV